MSTIMYFLSQIRSNKKGQGMVEYGLIIGLIAIVVIVALSAMGGSLETIFNGIKDNLNAVDVPAPAAS